MSYYDIRVKNILRAAVNDPRFTVQQGDQYSKGVKLDLISNPVKGLFIKVGWAYNDSKLTNAQDAINGRRPVNSGAKNAVNWYVSYTFEGIAFNDLRAGFGGNFNGRNDLINNAINGQFYTNEYTLLNANVFYDRSRYRFSLNIENLANRKCYFGGFGTFTPGMLRSILVSILVRI